MKAIARLALLGCVLVTGIAQAQYLNTLATSPLTRFSEADNKLFMAAIDKALADGADGMPLAWKNEATPATGVVTPEKTYTSAGMKCRDLLIANGYKTLKSEAVHTLCQSSAGQWKLLQ